MKKNQRTLKVMKMSKKSIRTMNPMIKGSSPPNKKRKRKLFRNSRKSSLSK